jgi:hypothetical protein
VDIGAGPAGTPFTTPKKAATLTLCDQSKGNIETGAEKARENRRPNFR